MTKRIAIVTSRPVYYYVPLYRLIAAQPGIELVVVYTTGVGTSSASAQNINHYESLPEELQGYTYHLLRGGENIKELNGLRTSLNWNIVPYIRDGRFDVVWIHGYNIGTNMLAALAQRIFGRGKVWLRDDQHLRNPRARWKQRFKRAVLPRFFGHWSGLYVGTLNREWLRYFGIPDNRLFHVPHAPGLDADNDGFERTAIGREMAHHDAPVLLTVGRMVWEKDYQLLLKAFARVRAHYPCSLVIVGDGPERESLEQLALDLNLGKDALIFAGQVDAESVSNYYQSADIFLLSSKSETWGLVVQEAMQRSLPVVVSDRVGCSEDLVQHGVNGFVFQTGSEEELAAALTELVKSPDMRDSFGRASRRIVEDWTHQRALRGVLEALEVTTSSGSRR